MNLNFNEFSRVCYEAAADKGWHPVDDKVTFVERLCLLHSEISEALEDYRNGDEPQSMYVDETTGKPEGVAIELCDILVRLADLCGTYNIDMDAALEAKISYNSSRSQRHGGKRL